jgi:Proteasome/cyclosome repeat
MNPFLCVQSLELLAPHLPGADRTVSPYSEGGALFALGLIHASAGAPVLPFLSASLAESGHEVVQHGACLGLGLAALGSGDDAVYDRLKGTPPRRVVLCRAGRRCGLVYRIPEVSRARDGTGSASAPITGGAASCHPRRSTCVRSCCGAVSRHMGVTTRAHPLPPWGPPCAPHCAKRATLVLLLGGVLVRPGQ